MSPLINPGRLAFWCGYLGRGHVTPRFVAVTLGLMLGLQIALVLWVVIG